MSRKLLQTILPLLVASVLAAACSGDAYSGLLGDLSPATKASAGVYVGEVIADDPGDGDVSLVVTEVLWQRATTPVDGEAPAALAQVRAGDAIPLKYQSPEAGRAKQATPYVFVVSQSGIGTDNPLWHTFFVYEHETMEPLGEINPPLEAVLLPGEEVGSQADLLAALVELVKEKSAHDDASNRGESAPVGPRLQAAWDYLGIGTEPDPVVIDESLGMPIRQYLGLPADERQLLAFGEMPAAVVEELGLIPVEALVIFDKGFADQVWAVGLRTSAGTIGPYQLDSGLGVQTIEGSAPVGDEMKLMVWAEPPDDPTRVLDGAMAADLPGALRAEVASVRLTGDEGRVVIVIDVVAESVSVVSGPEADEFIQRHITTNDG